MAMVIEEVTPADHDTSSWNINCSSRSGPEGQAAWYINCPSGQDQKILCQPAEEPYLLFEVRSSPTSQARGNGTTTALQGQDQKILCPHLSGQRHGTLLLFEGMDQKILCPQAEEVPPLRPRAMVHQLLFEVLTRRSSVRQQSRPGDTSKRQ